MTTAVQSLTRVRQSASQKMRPEPRQVGALADYDFTRQGDVYIYRLPKAPLDATRVKNPAAQVAPGETQGSRHCIDDVSKVQVYRLQNPNALQGPIIDAPLGFTLEHPEHGHQVFPAGCYMITFQRAHALELRRVVD